MSFEGIGIDAHSPRINGVLSVLEKDLKRFKQFGFDFVEIPVCGVDGVVNGRLNERAIKKLRNILAEFPYRYSAHASDRLNLKDIDFCGEHYNVLKTSLEFASKIKSNVLVYHFGSLRNKAISPQKAMKNEIEVLKEMAVYAQENNIKICLENTEHSIMDVVEALEKIEHENVAMTLDPGHGYLAANYFGFDFLEAIKMAKPYIQHIHLHDNFGKVDLTDYQSERSEIDRIPYGLGDLHLPPGWGDIPIYEVFNILNDYQGVVIAEISDERYYDDYAEVYNYIKKLEPETQI